jgi:hypothetical protein
MCSRCSPALQAPNSKQPTNSAAKEPQLSDVLWDITDYVTVRSRGGTMQAAHT